MAVDLAAGGDSPVRITSARPRPGAVRAAVEEAGYTVAA